MPQQDEAQALPAALLPTWHHSGIRAGGRGGRLSQRLVPFTCVIPSIPFISVSNIGTCTLDSPPPQPPPPPDNNNNLPQLKNKSVDLLSLEPSTDVEVLVNQVVRQEPLISDARKPQLRKLVYKLIEKQAAPPPAHIRSLIRSEIRLILRSVSCRDASTLP